MRISLFMLIIYIVLLLAILKPTKRVLARLRTRFPNLIKNIVVLPSTPVHPPAIFFSLSLFFFFFFNCLLYCPAAPLLHDFRRVGGVPPRPQR